MKLPLESLNKTLSIFNSTTHTTDIPCLTNIILPFYIFLTLQASITIIANGLLCWLFFTHRKLRTKQNHFIISLNFSDLLIGFVVIPCEYCHWQADRHVPKNEVCTIFCGSIISFNMTASVINLVLIGADRYLSVEKPFLYEQLFSKKRALLIIAIGWCIAIIVTILPIIWELIPSRLVGEQVKHLINVIYTITMFFLTLFVGTLIFIIYQRIISIVRSKMTEQERRTTGIRVCILSTMLFFVSWIPSIVTEILIQLNVYLPHLVGDLSYFILMLGPCFDPMLYAYYRKDFRKCLGAWVRKKLVSVRINFNESLSQFSSTTSR